MTHWTVNRKIYCVLLVLVFDVVPFCILTTNPLEASFLLENIFFIKLPNEKSDSNVEIIFVGDIMLARRIEDKIEETNINYPFEPAKPYLDTADFRIGNLECILSDNGELLEERTMEFRASPKVIEGLKYANFNLLTLANNHILDYGCEALDDTVDILDEKNINTNGLYTGEDISNSEDFLKRPIIFEKNGLKFAFLSYAHDPPKEWDILNPFYKPIPLNESFMMDEINFVKQTYKEATIIVQIHWRIQPQYQFTHIDFQEQICQSAIDAGATLVACHGPHTLQEIEAYESRDKTTQGLILYSLGNFVFDLSNESSWKSLIANVHFSNSGIEQISLVPLYRIDYQYIPIGKEKTYEYKTDLELNIEDFNDLFEEFFSFRYNFGTFCGILFSLPVIYIVVVLKAKRISKYLDPNIKRNVN